MLAERLRQLRMARGMSLEALASAMGGIVTKQAISKYETGRARPTPLVLNRLAAALGVKVVDLCMEPSVQIEFVGYRKRMRLPKSEQGRIEALVRQSLEERLRLQELIGQTSTLAVPVQSMPIDTVEDAEEAAKQLRAKWKLGFDPVGDLVGVLEERLVHVLEVDAADRFDGISAVARRAGRLVAAAVVTRRNMTGERQRLRIAHELGHLVLRVAPGLEEEKAAFRFAAAFLAPAVTLRRDVGTRRSFVTATELLLLKRRFGMSIQTLVLRLRDLGIITQSYYRQWCIDLNRLGWKRKEPAELPPERPTWLQRTVLRALGEGLVSRQTAEQLMGKALPGERALELAERHAFLKLPLEERRQWLARQADELAAYYQADPRWRDFQGGDFVDYSAAIPQTP